MPIHQACGRAAAVIQIPAGIIRCPVNLAVAEIIIMGQTILRRIGIGNLTPVDTAPFSKCINFVNLRVRHIDSRCLTGPVISSPSGVQSAESVMSFIRMYLPPISLAIVRSLITDCPASALSNRAQKAALLGRLLIC